MTIMCHCSYIHVHPLHYGGTCYIHSYIYLIMLLGSLTIFDMTDIDSCTRVHELKPFIEMFPIIGLNIYFLFLIVFFFFSFFLHDIYYYFRCFVISLLLTAVEHVKFNKILVIYKNNNKYLFYCSCYYFYCFRT